VEGQPFRPLGTTRDIRVDVRLIVAFNEDLPAMVQRGDFLADLFERLRCFFIEVPGLSERRIDIPILAAAIVARYAAMMDRDPPLLSDALMRVLMHAPWPGNIRELAGSLGRMIANARGAECLDLEHLTGLPELTKLARQRSLDDYTTEELQAQIGESNVSAVARKLGVDRTTIHRRMKRDARDHSA
jgi:DNA-binding NtrC family response regulator